MLAVHIDTEQRLRAFLQPSEMQVRAAHLSIPHLHGGEVTVPTLDGPQRLDRRRLTVDLDTR